MIYKTKALLALTASALVGSAHANVIYSNENFEDGTPNYTIDHTANAGAGTLTQLQDVNLVNIPATTAFAGTGFLANSPTLMGIVASGEPTNFSPGGTVPTGKHAFVSNSANRSIRLATPMTLVSDNVISINISFSYMLYGLGTADFIHPLELVYSANGLFTDTAQIATFGFLPNTPANPAGTHYPDTQDTWTSASVSIASTDVTFTDTANLRLNKMAPQNTSQIVFLDDIMIIGISAVVATDPFVVTIVPAVDPNTGYDLQWTSQTGKTYSVLVSTDLQNT